MKQTLFKMNNSSYITIIQDEIPVVCMNHAWTFCIFFSVATIICWRSSWMACSSIARWYLLSKLLFKKGEILLTSNLFFFSITLLTYLMIVLLFYYTKHLLLLLSLLLLSLFIFPFITSYYLRYYIYFSLFCLYFSKV